MSLPFKISVIQDAAFLSDKVYLDAFASTVGDLGGLDDGWELLNQVELCLGSSFHDSFFSENFLVSNGIELGLLQKPRHCFNTRNR